MDGSLLISGQPVTVTLGIKPGKGCAGSIDMDSKGSAKLIMIGKTMYLNPDDKYWEAGLGSAAAAAAIHLVNGRYIKTTTSGGLPEGSDSIAGVLSFSPGAPVTLTAPPASDVVEGPAVGSS